MLEVDRLSKRYGDVVALDQASFVVPPGRIVGFLGPNGAGKTTAMRCMFGLAEPDSGQVLWDGRRVGHAERLRFGYMPEERGLYPKMRVREELVYFGRLSGMTPGDAADSADHWLATLGLAERANSRLDELSHGNQQRVQLAVALVHRPDLLVLDEPFAGLDPLGIESMSEMLTSEAAQGVGIVFSSHQLDLVEDVCEDVVIIDRGRIVLAGSVAQLRARSDKVRVEVTVDGLPWVPEGDLEQQGANHRSYLAAGSMEIDKVFAEAAAHGEVTSFSYGPPHLSDLFREAVGR